MANVCREDGSGIVKFLGSTYCGIKKWHLPVEKHLIKALWRNAIYTKEFYKACNVALLLAFERVSSNLVEMIHARVSCMIELVLGLGATMSRGSLGVQKQKSWHYHTRAPTTKGSGWFMYRFLPMFLFINCAFLDATHMRYHSRGFSKQMS